MHGRMQCALPKFPTLGILIPNSDIFGEVPLLTCPVPLGDLHRGIPVLAEMQEQGEMTFAVEEI